MYPKKQVVQNATVESGLPKSFVHENIKRSVCFGKLNSISDIQITRPSLCLWIEQVEEQLLFFLSEREVFWQKWTTCDQNICWTLCTDYRHEQLMDTRGVGCYGLCLVFLQIKKKRILDKKESIWYNDWIIMLDSYHSNFNFMFGFAILSSEKFPCLQ